MVYTCGGIPEQVDASGEGVRRDVLLLCYYYSNVVYIYNDIPENTGGLGEDVRQVWTAKEVSLSPARDQI